MTEQEKKEKYMKQLERENTRLQKAYLKQRRKEAREDAKARREDINEIMRGR